MYVPAEIAIALLGTRMCLLFSKKMTVTNGSPSQPGKQCDKPANENTTKLFCFYLQDTKGFPSKTSNAPLHRGTKELIQFTVPPAILTNVCPTVKSVLTTEHRTMFHTLLWFIDSSGYRGTE